MIPSSRQIASRSTSTGVSLLRKAPSRRRSLSPRHRLGSLGQCSREWCRSSRQPICSGAHPLDPSCCSFLFDSHVCKKREERTSSVRPPPRTFRQAQHHQAAVTRGIRATNSPHTKDASRSPACILAMDSRTPLALPQASDDGRECRVKQYELVRVLDPVTRQVHKIRTDADPDVYRRFRSRMHVAGSYTGAASAVMKTSSSSTGKSCRTVQ